MPRTPEEKARQTMDTLLQQAGWTVQNRANANIDAARGVAIREFSLGHGFGEADYLRFVDGRAAGVIEAKNEGTALVGVEIQTRSTARVFQRPFPLRSVPCRSATSPPGSKPASPICWNLTPAAAAYSASTRR